MSLDAFHPAIVNTVIGRLAMLFIDAARGDVDDACDAAREMLESHNPRTRQELALAAHFIGMSFHSLDLLGQAADREQPPDRALRVLGKAIGLHREALKSQRALAALQRNDARPAPAEPEQPAAETQADAPAPAQAAGPQDPPRKAAAAGTPYRPPGQGAQRRPLHHIRAESLYRTDAVPIAVPA
jgi:hypothetical protein